MNKRTLLASLAAFVSLSAGAEVPDRLESPHEARQEPVWVSEELFFRGGVANWHLLSEGEAASLKRYVERVESTVARDRSQGIDKRQDECRFFKGSLSEGPKVDGLSELVAAHEGIFIGTVADSKVGLFAGEVSSLFELTNVIVLKGNTSHVGTSLLFFRRIGRMEVMGQMVCSVSGPPDRNTALVPGSRAIVFSSKNLLGIGGLPAEISSGQWVAEGGQGLSTPASLATSVSATKRGSFDQLVEQIVTEIGNE